MLRDLLRGCVACQPQSVANMTVVPLVGQQDEYNNIGTVADVYLEADRAYDRLTLGSASEHPTIVPPGTTLVTKEKAQDRAIPGMALIKGGSVQEVNAFCVQSSQAGHMRKEMSGRRDFRMLPARLRLAAFRQRDRQDYATLWDELSKFNTSLKIPGNFLATFFDNFRQQLELFLAEFELVPHQRGAIVLINGQVAGVEIAANPLAFAQSWEPLIRDCYGSEAIIRQQEVGGVDHAQMDTMLLGEVDTLEALAEAVAELEEKEYEYAESLIEGVLNEQQRTQKRQLVGDLRLVDLETADYLGQAIQEVDTSGESGRLIHLSLLRREAAQRGFLWRRKNR